MHYHIPVTGSKFYEWPHSSIPLEMEIWAGLGTLALSWSGVSPPGTNVGADVWRLIAVSPKDTVSFHTVMTTENKTD